MMEITCLKIIYYFLSYPIKNNIFIINIMINFSNNTPLCNRLDMSHMKGDNKKKKANWILISLYKHNRLDICQMKGDNKKPNCTLVSMCKHNLGLDLRYFIYIYF